MDSEGKYAAFKLGLDTEFERINSSYNAVYGDGDNAPTARTFLKLYLDDNLPWEELIIGEEVICTFIKVASSPTRDTFLSLAASAVNNLQLQEEDRGCHATVGILLIAMYMSTYQHFYTTK
jgi:hypothetical protein